jgi:hypothetical protein
VGAGAWGRAQNLQALKSQLLKARTQTEVTGTVIGAKTTNVLFPLLRAASAHEKKPNKLNDYPEENQ